LRTQTTSSESVEMYLKTIAELSDGQTPVSIARVAERLRVTPVSGNEMVKRLVEQGYLRHERYKGVILTDPGRHIAHSVMRRQRLWECFLLDHLKINWAGVYEMACRLEHATSSVLAEALASYLDHPTVCPHGNPIPTASGEVTLSAGVSLGTLDIGQSARIVSIQPTRTDVFAYLQDRHLQPGQIVRVLAAAPLQGPLTLDVEATEIVLGRNLAQLLMVQLLSRKRKEM
jgi:DtxR family Mn-dependent transcriptional regulator